MLPGFKCDALKSDPKHRGIRASPPTLLVVLEFAERIRLPIDHTQSQSDTVGKLFVLLPTPFEGGQWEVTQSESQTSSTFRTNLKTTTTTLQWAAIRANCNVTIHPIQRGHQIILKYNLVVSQRVGGLLLSTPNKSRMCFTNPSNFPLYARVKNLLGSPGFMSKGGRLGVYCRYAYFHTKPNTKKVMPQALQGIDMVFYSIFCSLGLKPEVRPLFDVSMIGDLIDDIYEYGYPYEHEKEWYKREPLCFAEMMGFDREEVKCSREFPDFLSQEEWKET